MNPQQQKEYMEKFKGGDQDSFLVLYHEFKKPIFYYLLTLLKNQADAEELTHDTFLKIFTRKQQYDSQYSFTTWAWSIARNTAVDKLRKKDPLSFSSKLEDQGQIESLTESSEDQICIEDLFELQHQKQRLLAKIDLLPTQQREIVSLRLYSDLELQEIANITQRNLSSVKSLFYRAQKTLSKELIVQEQSNQKEVI